MLDHNFNTSRFTVGIEEELMLLDPETFDLTDGIETILAAVPAEHQDQVKPELFQSVLEVATNPCENVAGGDRPSSPRCASSSAGSPPTTTCSSAPPAPTPSRSATTRASSSATATST